MHFLTCNTSVADNITDYSDAYYCIQSHLLILYYLLYPYRMSKSGTFATWTPFWILLNMKAASPLRVLTHPTCILACGRPLLHGTLRTWTSTVSTTCTSESPNHGMEEINFLSFKSFILILRPFCRILIHSIRFDVSLWDALPCVCLRSINLIMLILIGW